MRRGVLVMELELTHLCQFFYPSEKGRTRHGAGAKVDVSSGTEQRSDFTGQVVAVHFFFS